MIALALSFSAGALTTINPCVLPLLPVLAAAALTSGRMGLIALGSGLIASFIVLGVAISATGTLFGLDEGAVRIGAGILLVAAGIVLLVPALQLRLAAVFAPAGSGGAILAERAAKYGIAGQFAVGLLVGVIWTPCSGPSLGAAFALAAEAGSAAQAALRMFVFGLGAVSALGLLAYGSHALIQRRRQTMARLAQVAKPVAGVLFIAVGLAVFTGLDRRLEAFLTEHAPEWLIVLTTTL